MLFTPFGVAGWGKTSREIACIGHFVARYSGNPKLRYDTVFSLGPFNINKSPFRYPFWAFGVAGTPFGVAGRGKASREIACIVHFVLLEP